MTDAPLKLCKDCRHYRFYEGESRQNFIGRENIVHRCVVTATGCQMTDTDFVTGERMDAFIDCYDMRAPHEGIEFNCGPSARLFEQAEPHPDDDYAVA